MADQKLNDADLQELKQNTNNRSLRQEIFLAKEAKSSLPESYRKTTDVSSSDDVSSSERINRLKALPAQIAAKDKELRANNNIGSIILGVSHEVLIRGSIAGGIAAETAAAGAIVAGLPVAPAVTAALVVGGAAYLGNKALDMTVKIVENKMREDVRRQLKTGLSNLERGIKDGSVSQVEFNAAKNDPKALHQLLKDKVKNIFDPKLEEIPPEEQDLVNAFYSKSIADVMSKGFDSLNDVSELQQNQIDDNRKNIVSLARTFKQFAHDNNKKLHSIVETQNQIQGQLSDINDRVGKTEQGVQFLQEFMFGKMTPDEQIRSLNQGWLPEIAGEDRELLIKAAESRQNLEKIASYINGANQIVDIARKLGVNPAIVQKAEIAVSVGNIAMDAFNAFSTGNFLGGVSALAGIFGLGGGRDIAGERHKEVMGMLGNIYEQTEQIRKDLAQLEKNQMQIMELQVTTLKALQSISEQINKNHKDIMDKLERIHGDVVYNRQLILSSTRKAYAACNKLITGPGQPIMDTGRGIFPTYAELRNIFRNHAPSSFLRCTGQLMGIRLEDNSFEEILRLKSWDTIDNNDLSSDNETKKFVRNVTDYIELVYTPLLQFVLNSDAFSDITLDRRLASALSPMLDTDNLDLKIKEIKDNWRLEDDWQERYLAPISELLKFPLHTYAVKMHVDRVLNVHPYYQLLNRSTGKLRKLDELINADNDEISFAGLEDLQEAQNLVDVAIIQQVLLSGDTLLPSITNVFMRNYKENPDDTTKRAFDLSLEVLKNNTILAQNFFKYIIRKQVTAHSNLITYYIALESSDAALLNRIFNSRETPNKNFWNFHKRNEEDLKEGDVIKIPKGWSINLADRYYALPSIEDLQQGKLIYHPDVYMLLALQSRIIDEINSYKIFDSFPDQIERLKLNELLLNSI